jgi:hypothetical protein
METGRIFFLNNLSFSPAIFQALPATIPNGIKVYQLKELKSFLSISEQPRI